MRDPRPARDRGAPVPPAPPRSSGDAATPSEVLARAFAGDAFWTWVLPPGSDHLARLTRVFDALLRAGAAGGDRVVTDPTGRAAALWCPPGAPRSGLFGTLRTAPDLLPGTGTGIGRLLYATRVYEDARPTEPHGYLSFLGTLPEARGQGLASALLADILPTAQVAWLETEDAANVPFYERHGFVVAGTRTLGWGGPKVYFLRRRVSP